MKNELKEKYLPIVFLEFGVLGSSGVKRLGEIAPPLELRIDCILPSSSHGKQQHKEGGKPTGILGKTANPQSSSRYSSPAQMLPVNNSQKHGKAGNRGAKQLAPSRQLNSQMSGIGTATETHASIENRRVSSGNRETTFLSLQKSGVMMVAKKVDALEENLDGEMSKMKATVEDRISSMEVKVSDLHEMVKRILKNQNQMAASEARGPVGRNTNSEIRRTENDVEIIEERDGRIHVWEQRQTAGSQQADELGLAFGVAHILEVGVRALDMQSIGEGSMDKRAPLDLILFVSPESVQTFIKIPMVSAVLYSSSKVELYGPWKQVLFHVTVLGPVELEPSGCILSRSKTFKQMEDRWDEEQEPNGQTQKKGHGEDQQVAAQRTNTGNRARERPTGSSPADGHREQSTGEANRQQHSGHTGGKQPPREKEKPREEQPAPLLASAWLFGWSCLVEFSYLFWELLVASNLVSEPRLVYPRLVV
ncbi:hypothetical protein M5K25_019304 [Dendrobium thyrsiflorum]|uniref:Uncharacterized protein n=1 Tax=Dendrobium thyrsiflorum TaxID=117978 RepID=A0ABD0UEN9_DENTH